MALADQKAKVHPDAKPVMSFLRSDVAPVKKMTRVYHGVTMALRMKEPDIEVIVTAPSMRDLEHFFARFQQAHGRSLKDMGVLNPAYVVRTVTTAEDQVQMEDDEL